MKQLPKLTAAQTKAWGRVLEWRKRFPDGEYFTALGNAKWVAISYNGIPGTNVTFDAMLHKGVLTTVNYGYGYSRHYTIHPDYLPDAPDTSEPDTAPVAEDTPSFERGDIVRTKAIPSGEPLTVASTYTSPIAGITYVRTQVNGEPVSYIAAELEAVTAPASDPQPLDGERAEVLDALMASYEMRIADLDNENTELKMDVQRATNENAALTSQLEALRVYCKELEARVTDAKPAELHTEYTPDNGSVENPEKAITLLEEVEYMMDDVLAMLRDAMRKAPKQADYARGYVYNYLDDIVRGDSRSIPAWKDSILRDMEDNS